MEKECLFLYLLESVGIVLSCIVSSFQHLQIVCVHVHMCVCISMFICVYDSAAHVEVRGLCMGIVYFSKY